MKFGIASVAVLALMTIAMVAYGAGPAIGYYNILPKSPAGTVLEVAAMANIAGSGVDIAKPTKSPNQQWLVQPTDDGAYRIYAYNGMNSFEMLDYGGITTDGQPVLLADDDAAMNHDDGSQKWYFTDVGNSYYRIIPFTAGTGSTASLAIAGGPHVDPGAAIQISTFDASPSQEFTLKLVANPAVLPNPKKGLPTSNTMLEKAAGLMHCSWTYNWSTKAGPDIPPGIEFVPMVWGDYGGKDIGQKVLADAPGCKEVLGYNEPDNPNSEGGSNIAVDKALTDFQYISDLKSKGLIIGGPAAGVDVDAWMKTFMSQATAQPYNYNIDFIGFHDYASETNVEGAAYGMLGYADAVYKLYHKPMWVTEFAPTHLSPKDSVTFVRIVCQGFNKRPFIERYSMFTSEPLTDSGFGASCLVNPDGTLTPAGVMYSRM
jgi:hypothetical protein